MSVVWALTLVVAVAPPPRALAAEPCTYWLAPAPVGSDAGTGSRARPWATLDHATQAMPDRGCTLVLVAGTYRGGQEVERRFSLPVSIRAETPYGARLTHDDTVLHIDGARNLTIEGLEVTHTGPGASGYLVLVDAADGTGSSEIVIRNNIIHDSYDNDLLKAHNRSTDIVITGNLFYNQGPVEQHLDINSTERVWISRNVFFNDFAASGRPVEAGAKHFIVVKDSNEAEDGLLGARDTTIRDNVFLHWQGGEETFLRIGNDGKPYHEAVGVEIFNNLLLGDSPDTVGSVLGISGGRDVAFFNNTVVGDLPSRAFAMRITTKDLNPDNEDLVFANNIWSDPTGTMGAGAGDDSRDFSTGDPGTIRDLRLHNNLYWNGPAASVPGGEVADPRRDDPAAVFADPGVSTAPPTGPRPVWLGRRFADGSATVARAWGRLVDAHARLADGAAPIDRADPAFAPPTDMRGRVRGATPAIGAWDPGYSGAFADDDGSVFEADIEWLAAEEVTRGCNPPTNTLFCPEDPVTRGQMAAFLHRALGDVLDPGPAGSFTDDGGSVFEADIEWLAAVGVTRGCNPPSNSLFCPEDPVTRAQMAAFLHRALGGVLDPGPAGSFLDGDGSVFEADIEWLAAVGVTRGCNPPLNSLFCPEDPVTRAQMAAFLHRALGR
jgi:hypothetical protein